MLSLLRAAGLTLVGSLVASLPALASEGWIADYDEALKVAKAEKKDLFIDFTGSDWCGWCKKLDAEVFSHEEFLTAVKKDFVLVALDFPKTDAVKAKVPNPKRNEELRAQHGVEGYPTILLVTSDGEAFGQTGYRPGGPAAYVEHVTELRTKGKSQVAEVRGLIEAWTKAEGDAKVAAWGKLADALLAMGGESFAAKALVAPVRSALEFDQDNAKGCKKRAVTALLKSDNADEATLAAGKELDPKNADGLLEIVVKAQFGQVQSDDAAKAALKDLDALDAAGPVKDKETDFFLHVTAAFWCANYLSDTENAKRYAKRAKEIGSDNADAMQFIDQVLNS